jgi:hypothetical protein
MREYETFATGTMFGTAIVGMAIIDGMQASRQRAYEHRVVMAEAEGELVDALLDESALLTRLLDIRLAQLEALG